MGNRRSPKTEWERPRAARFVSAWTKLQPTDQHETLRGFLGGVIAYQETIEIRLSCTHLLALLTNSDLPVTKPEQLAKSQMLKIEVPAQLTNCGHGQRFVLPGEVGGEAPRNPDIALIKALVRAHDWNDKLVSGAAPSLRALSREHGLAERYMSRVLKLAYLAPDIVEAILEGRQPPTLTLQAFMQEVPERWDVQRRKFGFSS